MLGGSYANAIPSLRGNSTIKVHYVKNFLKFPQKNKHKLQLLIINTCTTRSCRITKKNRWEITKSFIFYLCYYIHLIYFWRLPRMLLKLCKKLFNFCLKSNGDMFTINTESNVGSVNVLNSLNTHYRETDRQNTWLHTRLDDSSSVFRLKVVELYRIFVIHL